MRAISCKITRLINGKDTDFIVELPHSRERKIGEKLKMEYSDDIVRYFEVIEISESVDVVKDISPSSQKITIFDHAKQLIQIGIFSKLSQSELALLARDQYLSK